MVAPWKESYDQPRQHIEKQRHHFADKGLYSQSYGFSIVMCGCENWTIKKAEHRRINTLATWCEELTCWKRSWCWERLRAGGEGDDKNEMVGWQHQLNGHEFEQIQGDGEGQGSLVCCSPWGRKESDTTEQLNNNNLNIKQVSISDPRRPGGRVGINDIIGNLGFSFRWAFL